jgi:hypothetical protein
VKTLEEGKSTDVNITRHLWIPPTLYGKSLDDNPYSEIFNKFRQEMKEADLCLTIGYSFRDKLVNEEFKEFIKSKKKLFILDLKPNVIAEHLGLPSLEDKKLGNPDEITDFITYEHTYDNITFIPLNFRKENIHDIVDVLYSIYLKPLNVETD